MRRILHSVLAGESIASISRALRAEQIPIPSEHWKRIGAPVRAAKYADPYAFYGAYHPMLNEFIEKIIVHAGEGHGNDRRQQEEQAAKKALSQVDPAAKELAEQRAYASEATKKSRQKMYEEAAAGNAEAAARYERYLAVRRDPFHRVCGFECFSYSRALGKLRHDKVNTAPGGCVNLGAMFMQLLASDKGGVEVGAVLFKVDSIVRFILISVRH